MHPARNGTANDIDGPLPIFFNTAPPSGFRHKMKVLFDHHLPFSLAHGGLQHQLEQTKAALERAGVETDFVRWWDAAQRGEIIHFFGRPTADYIAFAHGKGCKVVMAELLSAVGSRSRGALMLQRAAIRFFRSLLPRIFTTRLAWDAYRRADACIALTTWEAHLMNYLFSAPRERIHVVPNGVEEIFFNQSPTARGPWLVSTVTLTEVKRILELAQAAILAQTPLWVIGRAYAESDPYAQKFFALARQNARLIRYEGAISDRAQLAKIYREARGFVLLSRWETQSLSALEAAAGGCPLLLSDLPWARSTFGKHASYCPLTTPERTATFLKKFYDTAPTLPEPPKPASWDEVARKLKTIYEGVLSTSR